MKLKSMTGYGRGEAEKKGRVFSVEVRCVNNRYLDAKIKVPRDYSVVEDPIRKMISEFHHRGRVDLSLSVSGDFSDLFDVRVNREAAEAYRKSLTDLAELLGTEAKLDLSWFSQLPDVLVREQQAENIEELLPAITAAVNDALQSCAQMRTREAALLVEDLAERLGSFSGVLNDVEKRLPELIAQRESSLQERLQKLLGNVELDPLRIAQEVAVLADRTDVTEELVRLRSHICQFEEMLQASGAIGRKLDFLIQEFLREVNTMASKINDADIAHMMVALKSELEKMREQVQNIE
ncbi:MAG: YicC/YloC family endoribonuclease [Desulfocapsaceae bacterium]|jgi:uncharacterized protein (TIGR00255 family)|nr:YicC/YloC family endoribonuclease [Desulfocapsaceae bacterium]